MLTTQSLAVFEVAHAAALLPLLPILCMVAVLSCLIPVQVPIMIPNILDHLCLLLDHLGIQAPLFLHVSQGRDHPFYQTLPVCRHALVPWVAIHLPPPLSVHLTPSLMVQSFLLMLHLLVTVALLRLLLDPPGITLRLTSCICPQFLHNALGPPAPTLGIGACLRSP